jgi:hypothetical protein
MFAQKGFKVSFHRHEYASFQFVRPIPAGLDMVARNALSVEYAGVEIGRELLQRG